MTRTLPPLIGLNGIAGSGKDSLAEHLAALHGYKRVAFADPLKQIALDLDPLIQTYMYDRRFPNPKIHQRLSTLVDLFGWRFCKDTYPEVREFLQNLGVGVRTHTDPNVWLCEGMRKADAFRRDGYPVVLTDVRFANEFEAVRLRSGLMVRISRPGIESGNHVSETALDRHKFDHHLINDGTLDDLVRRAEELHEAAL